MRETRSASQILFGFLPEQTVDLRGGVWKVIDWRHPTIRTEVDSDSLRREIVRHAANWTANSMDGGFVNHLKSGARISVLTLDEENGVDVEPFPKTWVCKSCKRVHDKSDSLCPCEFLGPKGQLFFVGYHEKCGALRQPWIPKCPVHRQVYVIFPGTASATEIRFVCPVCEKELRKGFGHVKCDCGEGNLTFQPHRAASVYTPRTVVLVNPPSREKIRAIAEAGGPPKALSWVVGGMKTGNIEQAPATLESLRRQLEGQGLPQSVVDQMLKVARNAQGPSDAIDISFPAEVRDGAEAEAVTIALATVDSRLQVKDLVQSTTSASELGGLYRVHYPAALRASGLEGVDLLDRFPVLTGHYGYTRGDHEAGKGKLVPYRGRHEQGYRVYADIAETEALFVRLDAERVAGWLTEQGQVLPHWTDAPSARRAIIIAASKSASTSQKVTVKELVFRLVHSYSHRMLRVCAVHAGIDRNALSELLVPLHLGFFLYAAAKGDFVLGGLQAVFETELHALLTSVVYGEHRCALDPGCADSGGACMACLHIGEPSCRYFNLHLSRSVLFGAGGYLN